MEKVWLDELLKSPKLLELHQELQNGASVLIEDLWNAPKALVAAIAQAATGKHILILTGASQEEVRLYHDFPFFTNSPVVDFPAWETLPSENVAPSPDIVGERYATLHQLSIAKQPHIVLSGLQACLQKILPPQYFEELYLRLTPGTLFPFQKLIDHLIKMGYQRLSIASDKGQFAVRGGIIDVFPVSSPDPYRLEFWGDDIETMRIYDPIGQKSIRPMEFLEITPAQELELIDKKAASLCTIIDYLGPNTIVICDDLLALEDRYASLVSMLGASSKFFCGIEEFFLAIKPLQKLFWSQQPIEELSEVRTVSKKDGGFYSETIPMQEICFEMFGREILAKRWIPPFSTVPEVLCPGRTDLENISKEDLLSALGTRSKEGMSIHVICPTDLEKQSFYKRLSDACITLSSETKYEIGYLSNGLAVDDISTMIFPLTEISKRFKIRRQKLRSTYHTAPTENYTLSSGDMVVHYGNGIGRYLGLEKLVDHNGVTREFMTLEYADSAKLFVPLHQAHLVNKYIGASEEIPKMHTLGNPRWQKARGQAESAIRDYAKDLLELYARREVKGGFSYDVDSAEMQAFEDAFPYTETEDQLRAIASIKQDMISNKAMDRLICGDVGYGKTEVSMRAAFKAVVDGRKQVAVLVPTTVLAMQHYESFLERFSDFPINIGVLSRFRTAKQTKETLLGLKEGSIDIVIGTHRVVSDDVVFKDLGLIIIDEEQRFGVNVKEHLKKIKVNADCLTLSATPIPRTLYMSLVGAKDMSVINTPPQDRLPITTIVTESNDQVMKNALLRELSRNGQAFIIHNRVETIYEFASHIQKLLPQSRIVVGHGQMSSAEIDHVFHLFKSGQADILVATTIVENGIDIPNANTILIDRSDRFGMADLYQLRGRVGRWNRRAYAYLFVPSRRVLAEIVLKRLNALASSSGYGGGMKVAMHDLEIRGAGNILGTEQSGQVASIGFHLYCKLLKRTILTMQGKAQAIVTDTKVEFPVDARIPEDYISEPHLRMEIYQRLGESSSWGEIDEIWNELKDRFGKPPIEALWLYHLSRIRSFAAERGYTLIKQEKFTLTIERQQNKQQVVKKLSLPKITTPEAMEKNIIALL